MASFDGLTYPNGTILQRQISITSAYLEKYGPQLGPKFHGLGYREGRDRQISFIQRLKHFTWAWFTLTMSTGGLALLLTITPHRFKKIYTLGTILYILDLILFIILSTGIVVRFVINRKTFKRSLKHPSEALFMPTFWLSLPTIIGGMQIYGVPHVGEWLPVTLRILFWLYCACTTLVAVCQYYYLFLARQLTAQSMTPVWILPIFPAMLIGTLASLLAPSQPPDQRLPMIVAGVAYQGLGMLVSLLMYTMIIARLMEYGLPGANLRPGMFMCVGPPSFTALALIGMSNSLPRGYGYFADNPEAINALRAIALFTAVFLWAFAFWWFAIAVIGCLTAAKEMTFHLAWYAFVFPNVGFTIATISIGNELKSQGIQWVGSAMTILVVLAWFFVISNHMRALLTKRMMMPGLDEDKGEDTDDE